MELRTVNLALPWPPTTGNNLYTGMGRGRHLKPCVLEYWSSLWEIWHKAGRPRFAVEAEIHWSITQPRENDVDWDNVRKIVMDGLSEPKRCSKHIRATMFSKDSMVLIRRETMNWYGVNKHRACIRMTIVGE